MRGYVAWSVIQAMRKLSTGKPEMLCTQQTWSCPKRAASAQDVLGRLTERKLAFDRPLIAWRNLEKPIIAFPRIASLEVLITQSNTSCQCCCFIHSRCTRIFGVTRRSCVWAFWRRQDLRERPQSLAGPPQESVFTISWQALHNRFILPAMALCGPIFLLKVNSR